MSLPTALRVVDDVVAEGLVCYEGSAPSIGGRPRALVRFDGEAYAVIGIDLGGQGTYGAVADLAGTVEQELELPRADGNPEQNLDDLCQVIRRLIEAPRPAGQRIRGIGVGAPGITLSPAGVVSYAPSLGWRDLPLQGILQDRFHLPVFVENDANLAAPGEWGFGGQRGAEHRRGTEVVEDGALEPLVHLHGKTDFHGAPPRSCAPHNAARSAPRQALFDHRDAGPARSFPEAGRAGS